MTVSAIVMVIKIIKALKKAGELMEKGQKCRLMDNLEEIELERRRIIKKELGEVVSDMIDATPGTTLKKAPKPGKF